MALSYKTRKRLSLLILVLGLPAYIIMAIWVVSLFNRPPIWLELIIYFGLGFLWMLPFKKVFLGVGKADPDEDPANYPHDPAGKYALKDEDERND
ncbi:DUF2842 domain-containing protein [Aliiroseovarius crassostreae]|uniref:DUF2842 domain-containing protein n=1 Tax=Aliiroseovarius crassostreae TaxID=154981 RepID=UPI0022092E5D|nr:DUF2842 domain-containing protein [Aliiroseovarius crassostreae]UWQ10078.1 DUF2842 domain-containing protein [Aliiroseovarius crassostreae]